MSDRGTASSYVGQVECDPSGTLWAVLYFRDQVIERARVRSLRHGKRQVTNMVLAAHDADTGYRGFSDDPRRSAPVPMHRRLVEQRPSARRPGALVSQFAAQL